MIDPATLAWDKMPDGLLPAVVQHVADGNVLMLGYMNRDALAATLETGFVTFFSRSKARLWRKGETSGNLLRLVSIDADCDGDALLVRAEPVGPTCHLGRESCFAVEPHGAGWLSRLEQVIAERSSAQASESYTARLIGQGIAKIAQKIGEEGVEVALAAVGRDADGLTEEAADLLFHLLVTLRSRDVPLNAVVNQLRSRHEAMRTGVEQMT